MTGLGRHLTVDPTVVGEPPDLKDSCGQEQGHPCDMLHRLITVAPPNKSPQTAFPTRWEQPLKYWLALNMVVCLLVVFLFGEGLLST